MSLSQERLRRLLFLVPYVSRHPGITVAALAKELGVRREVLLEELDLLSLVGIPPFKPDDFVDIYVEDDRVYVELAHRFSAPPQLTADEGVALAAAAAILGPQAGDALARGLEKLLAALPAQARTRAAELGQRLDVAAAAPSGLAALTEAISLKREVDFDYLTPGNPQPEHRGVQPHELFSHRGQWYLRGFCLKRNDVRLFRLDRLLNLAVSQRSFAAAQPGTLAPSRSAPESVRVHFTPAAAPYARERFREHSTWLPGGALEVEVPGDNVRWLTQWVMSFGGEAVVVHPMWAKESVAAAARASLES